MTLRRTALVWVLQLFDGLLIYASWVLAEAVARVGTPELRAIAGVIDDTRFSPAGALALMTYLAYWHVVLRACDVYRSHRLASRSAEVREFLMAVPLGVAPLLAVQLLVPAVAATRGSGLIFGATVFLMLVGGRWLVRTVLVWVRRVFARNLRDVVVVHDGASARAAVDRILGHEGFGYRHVADIEIVGDASPAEIVQRLDAIVKQQPVDELFIAVSRDGSRALVRALIAAGDEIGVMVRILADGGDLEWGWTQVDAIGTQPVVTVGAGPRDWTQYAIKRTIDVFVALIGLVVLAPLLLVLGLLIRLDSAGAVLFAQERIGLRRRPFRAFKLRTMVDGAEALQGDLEAANEAEGPIFKIRHDPRVTRVGHWLRWLSLDELPQLINVLRGDMSLVGPRPLPARDVSRIDVRWHNRRFSVKPGITCSWQAERREPRFDEWARSDMEYIHNWSLELDFRILARTLAMVVTRQGMH